MSPDGQFGGSVALTAANPVHDPAPTTSHAVLVSEQTLDEPLTRSLLDRMLDSEPGERREVATSHIQQFVKADSLAAQLNAWFGRLPRHAADMEVVRRLLARDLGRIDRLLTGQVNAILHHPDFQQLESAWRGLWFLTGQGEKCNDIMEQDGERDQRLEVRVLNVSKRELKKDFEKAAEFDQAAIFKHVYEEEFGKPGGEPYGLLVGNYEFTNHPDDVDLLGRLSGMAASAFAPIATSAAPELVGVDDFSTLQQPLNLSANFNQVEYIKWRALRERDDARFLGLTLPRILMRQPFRDDGSHSSGFRFTEDVEGPDRSRYLWGTAAWAFASVAMRAYATSGWFAEIRGAERGREGGGLVTDLETNSFTTDPAGVAIKSSTEVCIGDMQERELCNLGFVPLSDCHDTEYSVFYSNQSVNEPKTYDDEVATANARISAMLQYVLCSSRFAHYLKVRARNMLGSFRSPQEIESSLNEWLSTYVTPDDKAPQSIKAQFPLREGRTEVREIPGQPGEYTMRMYLRPHYQLDQLTASIRLVARLTPGTK